MGLSFAQMWEQIEKEKSFGSPLMTSGEPDRAATVVRTGKEMHGDKQKPFWDEFISLCSNSEGLSALLEVPSGKIRTWPAKIKEALERLNQQNTVDPTHKDKAEVIPTGLNGAITTNSDPINGMQ